MRRTWTVFKRELGGYFATPVAYVLIVAFLLLMSVFTFAKQGGNLYNPNPGQGQADLRPFFTWHPWFYMVLIPAITMRLWAEERRSGTIELLMTLPVSLPQAILGKFFAAWVFTGVALLLTTPVWITIAWLGNPDHGAIAAGYLGSFLMAGGFLAIGSCISALTKNQIIAFVVAMGVCMIFVLSGHSFVLEFLQGWAPRVIVDTVGSFSFITHFQDISKGVIDARDLLFFVSLIAFWLFANGVVLELRKAD